jgi:hypothetical protein
MAKMKTYKVEVATKKEFFTIEAANWGQALEFAEQYGDPFDWVEVKDD